MTISSLYGFSSDGAPAECAPPRGGLESAMRNATLPPASGGRAIMTSAPRPDDDTFLRRSFEVARRARAREPSLRRDPGRPRRRRPPRERERIPAPPRRDRARRAAAGDARLEGVRAGVPRALHALLLGGALRDVRRRVLLGRNRPGGVRAVRAAARADHRPSPGEPDARPALPRRVRVRAARDRGRGAAARGGGRGAARGRLGGAARLTSGAPARQPIAPSPPPARPRIAVRRPIAVSRGRC